MKYLCKKWCDFRAKRQTKLEKDVKNDLENLSELYENLCKVP